MSLLLDEIALASARLAEAGVESPRTDAELIAEFRLRNPLLDTPQSNALAEFDVRLSGAALLHLLCY